MTTTLVSLRTALLLGVCALGLVGAVAYAEERALNTSVSNVAEERPAPALQDRMMPQGYGEGNVRQETPQNRMVPQEVRPIVEARSQEAADRARDMEMRRLEAHQAAEARKADLEQNRLLLQQRAAEAEARRAQAMTTRDENVVAAQARALAQALTPVSRGVAILNAAIERMRILGDRIDSRIQKIEETGTQQEDARASLERARAELTAASQTLRAIEARIRAAGESENPREVLADIREALRAVHESLRGVQTHLRSAVEALQ